MREINNQQSGNMNTPIIPVKVEQKENLKENVPEVEIQEQQKEIKDLANMPAETLGRSQVVADTIENDVKYMLENPNSVETANEFFEMAKKVLTNRGDEDAAEKATLLTEAFKKEFLS